MGKRGSKDNLAISEMAKSSTGAKSKTGTKVLKAKRKPKSVQNDDLPENSVTCSKHTFTQKEVELFQQQLLKWYDRHQRKLPWRDIAKSEKDLNKRGYSVWVSEIMLQQTQVATVIPYYEKWLAKWPTVEGLSQASLEEVNETWAGLGYYSRAKRLHEGAKFITKSRKGCIPRTAEELKDSIPGIGKYTACAIASVAFCQPVGVVDGNVSRVLSRMRAIGCEISKPVANNLLWQLADDLVSKKCSSDFNQALMELGAVVCTPRNPSCDVCPVKELCIARAKSEKSKGKLSFSKLSDHKKQDKDEIKITDIENNPGCHFCIQKELWNSCPDVTVFPVKAEKKKSRTEKVSVFVVERDSHLLLIQRPDTGLLAGLWEFPSLMMSEDDNDDKTMSTWLECTGICKESIKSHRFVGEVLHIFSHIRTTYCVNHVMVDSRFQFDDSKQKSKWLTRHEFASAAVSTAMKKILASIDKVEERSLQNTRRKRPRSSTDDKKQKSIRSFFT